MTAAATPTEGIGPADGGPIGLRQGWRSAIAALVTASVTAVITADTGSDLAWLAARAAVVAVMIMTAGTIFGSVRLVGLAALPMLVGALLGADSSGGPSWGRSLIIGCLWYVAMELAWASIEQRDGTVRTDAIGRQRRREVSTVVIIAIGVGLGGALLASAAPTRTLVVRGLVIGSVLIAMIVAGRQLAITAALDEGSADPDPRHDA